MIWILPTIRCIFIAAASAQYFRQTAGRFVVYLSTIPVSQTVWRRIAVSELEMMRKKTVMVLAGALVVSLSGGIKVNHDNLRRDRVWAKI